MFYVYILYSARLKRFYTGTTDNVCLRLEQHNNGYYSDSFSTKGIPWELFLTIECKCSSQAYAIEAHIKQMKSSVYIKNLLKYPDIVQKLKNKY